MKLEGLIICQNYSDFLAESLPRNISHFDRLVVVTHPDDQKTRALCQKFSVDCIPTTEMHDNGDPFNKGRAINVGLGHLQHDGWLLHLDADIILPHKFRQMLFKAKLDPSCIYGADRQNTGSWENWDKHRNNIIPQHQWGFLTTPNPSFSVGARLVHNEFGYCPIGYFQLWHSSQKRRYPVISGSAEHSDVVFAIQWPLDNRVLLPELIVIHLESEEAPMGANWKGRKTRPFGPRPPQYVEPEKKHGHGHGHHHHHHKPPKPYCK